MATDKNAHFAGKYFEEIDLISEEDNYFKPVLNDVLSEIDVKSARVMDVGCGTGLFLKPLIVAGCTQLYGVDGPQDFTDRAIRRGYKEVSIVDDLNISPLPGADESFDLVVCKDVFEHLLQEAYNKGKQPLHLENLVL